MQQANPMHSNRTVTPGASWRFFWCEDCRVNVITSWPGSMSCPNCTRDLVFRFQLENSQMAERFEHKEPFPPARSRENALNIFKLKVEDLRKRAEVLVGPLPTSGIDAAFALLETVK